MEQYIAAVKWWGEQLVVRVINTRAVPFPVNWPIRVWMALGSDLRHKPAFVLNRHLWAGLQFKLCCAGFLLIILLLFFGHAMLCNYLMPLVHLGTSVLSYEIVLPSGKLSKQRFAAFCSSLAEFPGPFFCQILPSLIVCCSSSRDVSVLSFELPAAGPAVTRTPLEWTCSSQYRSTSVGHGTL